MREEGVLIIKLSHILGAVSVLIPFLLLVLIINFFAGVVAIGEFSGLPILMPIILCPIGAVIGLAAYRLNKDKLSLTGIVLNMILFLIPILYHLIGTVIFGV